MIYLEFNEKNEQRYRHNFPFHPQHGLGKTKEELEETGFLFESIPIPSTPQGKEAILKINTETKELYYEYIDRILSPDEEATKEIRQLQHENEILRGAIAELGELISELFEEGE